jgi:hypothetical protein
MFNLMAAKDKYMLNRYFLPYYISKCILVSAETAQSDSNVVVHERTLNQWTLIESEPTDLCLDPSGAH